MDPRCAKRPRSPVRVVGTGRPSGEAAASSASRRRLAVRPAPGRMDGVVEPGRTRPGGLAVEGPTAPRTRQEVIDADQLAKDVARRGRLAAAAAQASAVEVARAERRALAVAKANKKEVVKRCMCQMPWCQTTNAVDAYSHKLKSRPHDERLAWLRTLRPGTTPADLEARERLADNPGNLRAHTSHFHYYHKFWSGGAQRQTLRLKADATCHATKVHKTPEYPGEELQENSYERPLGKAVQADPGLKAPGFKL